MADADLDELTFGSAENGSATGGFADGQFVSAQIDAGGEKPGFSAAQYSFFGGMDDLDDGLEMDGGLEEGIDAPPEEEALASVAEEEDLGLVDPDLAATDDLGLATMLSRLGVDEKENDSGTSSNDAEGMLPSAPIIMPSASLLSGIPHRTPTSSYPSIGGVHLGTSPLAAMPPAPQLFAQPVDGAALLQQQQLQHQHQQHMRKTQMQQQTRDVPLEELEAAMLAGGGIVRPGGGGMMEAQQHQMPPPPPGRPPLPPWAQGPGSHGQQVQPQATPPPPPPPQHQRNRSQSPVARRPSPPLPMDPRQGHSQGGRGGAGFGFGYVNKHTHSGYQHPQAYQHQRRHRFSGRFMPPETIAYILRIQWAAVHTSRPYTEDYYYQAFIAKHFNGANAAAFAPDHVRTIAPQERASEEGTNWVPVEGLGKIAMSNIKHPKPLMELSTANESTASEHKNETGNVTSMAERQHRPLEQEPMLAARIMVEDVMCLLLDVDDVERLFRQADATGKRVEDPDMLLRRRAALLEGMAASLRLPDSATLSGPNQAAAGSSSDGVFLRLMTFPKGRTLLASALRRLFSPFASSTTGEDMSETHAASMRAQLRVIWAVMRNLRALFGTLPPVDPVASVAKLSKEGEAAANLRAAALQTTARIAVAAAEAIHRLDSPRACMEALTAAIAGDLSISCAGETGAAADLLPLVAPPGLQPADFTAHWLADILTALLERANVLGLGSQAAARGGGITGPVASEWDAASGRLVDMLIGHVNVVLQVSRAARAQGVQEGVVYARSVVPIPFVRAAFLHCTVSQREHLRTCLAELN